VQEIRVSVSLWDLQSSVSERECGEGRAIEIPEGSLWVKDASVKNEHTYTTSTAIITIGKLKTF
jgi:hypothetical protein